jgi:hypothetical protein
MPSILLVLKHAELDLHNLRVREKIARETTDEQPDHKLTYGTAAGDERKLRGIPCFGFGGAIKGSRPGTGRLFTTDGDRTDDWS